MLVLEKSYTKEAYEIEAKCNDECATYSRKPYLCGISDGREHSIEKYSKQGKDDGKTYDEK
jgi:hypothetical protein